MEAYFTSLLIKIMQYLRFKDYDQYLDVYKLWNENYGRIYPISKELFERNLSNASMDASYVAINDKELVGFIVCKFWNDEYFINTYEESAWISLFMVKPCYRMQGIGSKLLEKVEYEVKKLGKHNLFLGKDYFNFFPGLPVDLKNSIPWFTKRGFNRPYDTYDLIKKIKRNEPKIELRNKDITYRICSIDDKNNLINFIKDNWPGRWTKEAIDYFSAGGTGKEYVIGLDNNTICAFAKIGLPTTDTSLISYSLTWRKRFDALGGIGPLGVDTQYRKKNIGFDIVAFANNVLIDNGVTDIIIDWTGLLDFYRKLDFEVFKSYAYMVKEL